MKRSISVLSALLLCGAASVACSEAPPEQDPNAMDNGTGSTVGGDGDGSTVGGDGDGDGSTPGDGDGAVGDGDGSVGDGDGQPPLEGGPPFGHPDETMTYPEYDGFTLWLVEEFDEPLDLDSDPIWTWSDGGLPEGQVRFVREGVKFADGKMILEAKMDDGSIDYESCSHAENGSPFTKALTSGEMRTKYNLFRYGRYEVRMKAPSPNASDPTVNGNYIATLFTFRNPKFEEWREIDIEVTGDAANTVTTNVIYGDEQFEWSPGIADADAVTLEGTDTRTEFHDFAFEWLPDSITWYMDGEVIRTYGPNDARPIPDLSAKIMMNLWIFNASAAFGGPDIENNQYPMQTEYEWVRFYKWDGDDTYPCEDMNTNCLAEADMNLASNNPCDGISAEGLANGNPVCTATCN